MQEAVICNFSFFGPQKGANVLEVEVNPRNVTVFGRTIIKAITFPAALSQVMARGSFSSGARRKDFWVSASRTSPVQREKKNQIESNNKK